MSYNFRSTSNGDTHQFKRVIVTQVNLDTLTCEVQERSNNSKFLVSMESAVGLFYQVPTFGEEWIVTKVGGNVWVLHRKTSLQNPAVTEMRNNAAPGDVVLSAAGSIRVISPLIQNNVSNKWYASLAISSTTLTEVGTLSLANPANTSVATITATQRLKINNTGTYAVSFRSSTTSASTNRAYLEIELPDTTICRSPFHNEDFASLETTRPLVEDDILKFKIYHSAGSPLTFTSNIDITQVR